MSPFTFEVGPLSVTQSVFRRYPVPADAKAPPRLAPLLDPSSWMGNLKSASHGRCFGHERHDAGMIRRLIEPVGQFSEAGDLAGSSKQIALRLVAKLAFEKFEL